MQNPTNVKYVSGSPLQAVWVDIILSGGYFDYLVSVFIKIKKIGISQYHIIYTWIMQYFGSAKIHCCNTLRYWLFLSNTFVLLRILIHVIIIKHHLKYRTVHFLYILYWNSILTSISKYNSKKYVVCMSNCRLIILQYLMQWLDNIQGDIRHEWGKH